MLQIWRDYPQSRGKKTQNYRPIVIIIIGMLKAKENKTSTHQLNGIQASLSTHLTK